MFGILAQRYLVLDDRKQLIAQQDDEHQSDQRDGDTHPRQGKHIELHRRALSIDDLPISKQFADDKVCARADEGAGAAEHRRETQRHIQTRGVEIISFRPAGQHRQKHRHDRRVVDECAQPRHGKQQTGLRFEMRFRPTKQASGDTDHAPGFLESLRDDVEHADGDDRGIGESRHRLLGGNHAPGQQKSQGAEEYRIRPHSSRHQRRDKQKKNASGIYFRGDHGLITGEKSGFLV